MNKAKSQTPPYYKVHVIAKVQVQTVSNPSFQQANKPAALQVVTTDWALASSPP